MIRIENLQKTYDKTQALAGIDLHVPAGELLGYIELNDRIDSLIKHLSGGLKRRVMIARALATQPAYSFSGRTHRGAGCPTFGDASGR